MADIDCWKIKKSLISRSNELIHYSIFVVEGNGWAEVNGDILKYNFFLVGLGGGWGVGEDEDAIVSRCEE